MLLIFTKKIVVECLEADLFSFPIFPHLMLLVVGVRKRAVQKECLVLKMKCTDHKMDPKNRGRGQSIIQIFSNLRILTF